MPNVNLAGTASALDLATAAAKIKGRIQINKPVLMSIIQPLTELQSTSVVWDKDPRPMVSDVDRALVTLSLKASDQRAGTDDKRRSYSPGSNPPLTSHYVYEIVGPREVILTLKCEVYDYEAEAYEILEKVRTQLNANFELNAIGMCYQTCKMITDLPTTYDNRVVNVAMLEIQFGLMLDLLISDQIATGWVDTVNALGQPSGTNDISGTFT